MKLTRVNEPVEMSKRTYVPFELEYDCPGCGKQHMTDFHSEQYLSYPEAGKVFTEVLYCHACDHEWEISMMFDVSLSIVTEGDR